MTAGNALRQAAVLAAALPAHFPPTHIIRQDKDDIRFLPEFPFERTQLVGNLSVFGRPDLALIFPLLQKGAVGLDDRFGMTASLTAADMDGWTRGECGNGAGAI